MKKNVIWPHPVLLIEGRIFCMIIFSSLGLLWYQVIFNFAQFGLIGTFVTVSFTILGAIVIWYIWHDCWGKIIITDSYVKFCGFMISTVKLPLEDIQFVEIRVFKEGNATYGRNPAIDAHTYVLLSERRIGNIRMDKIRSSKKKSIIKFAVSKKLCQALVSVLPKEKAKPIEYMLFLYKRAKR